MPRKFFFLFNYRQAYSWAHVLMLEGTWYVAPASKEPIRRSVHSQHSCTCAQPVSPSLCKCSGTSQLPGTIPGLKVLQQNNIRLLPLSVIRKGCFSIFKRGLSLQSKPPPMHTNLTLRVLQQCCICSFTARWACFTPANTNEYTACSPLKAHL